MTAQKPTRRPANRWLPLLPIVALFLGLAGLYAWATPIFEASDELWHFGMVEYIAQTGQLPVQNPDVETRYRQEGSQPPLYYALGATLARAFDLSDLDRLTVLNPHAQVGVPNAVRNKNIVLHDPTTPIAWGGAAGAVYALRALSMLMGVGTLVCVYGVALQLGGRAYASLAVVLTAFNPMFIFIAASVNNDNLVTLLNSAILWLLVVMGWRGFRLWRTVLLALLLALASLSKLSGLVLMPVTLCASLFVAWQRRDWRGFVLLWALIVLAWGALAGWWYVRNILLYEELFGTSMMVAVAGARLEPFTWRTVINEFEGFRIAYWGLFGGVNILTWAPFYWLMDALTVLGLAGLILGTLNNLPYVWRDIRDYGRVLGVADWLHLHWFYAATLFSLAILFGFGGVISWTAQTYASQGRLLFPFIAAISALLATGLRWFWRAHHERLVFALGGLMFSVSLLSPLMYIAPAYAPPPTVAQLPASATPVYARYGEIELLGYTLEDRRYRTGDTLPITVYWRALEPSTRDLSAFLTALTPEGQLVGKVDTYPGGGTLTTRTWQPNVIYADRYGIPLDATRTLADAFDMRLQIGWRDNRTDEYILPVDMQGAPLGSVLLDSGAFVALNPANLRPLNVVRPNVVYGRQIALLGAEVEAGQVRLAWRALRNLNADYTAFVHVVDEVSGQLVGQGDLPPRLSTGYWRRGEAYISQHSIRYDAPLQAGHYRVYVGWYRPDDLSRLEIANNPQAAYLLGRFSFP